MNPHRELKRRARRQLHARMSEPVWFFASRDEAPVAATVRFHLRFDQLGELLRGGFAEQQEAIPKLIFMEPLPRLERLGMVVSEDMGVYRLDSVYPPDDITVTTEVVRLTDSQIEALGLNPDQPWCGLPAPPAVEGCG